MASPSAVSRQIGRLVELGYGERQPGTPRSIRLAQDITHAAASPNPEAPVGAVLDAEHRVRQAERALSAARSEIGRSRQRGARWKAEVRAVRALHWAVPEHPRACWRHTPLAESASSVELVAAHRPRRWLTHGVRPLPRPPRATGSRALSDHRGDEPGLTPVS